MDGLKLETIKNPAYIPNGPKAYAKAAAKYSFAPTAKAGFWARNGMIFKKSHHHVGGSAQQPLPAHEGSGETQVQAADIGQELEYNIKLKIGTPGVTLNLDPDTGSSDLWVWSSKLQTTAPSAGHNIYNPDASTTSKVMQGETWNIQYGDGSSGSGTIYTDTVQLGSLVIPNQAVEVATKLSSAFVQGSSDGLIGLAFPNGNTAQPRQVQTLVENMIKQNLIKEPLFTVKLDTGDSNGFFTFGYIEDGVTPTYINVDSSNAFWQFDTKSFTINGQVHQREQGAVAIADTGTTLLLVADAVVDAIYAAVPGARFDSQQGGYLVPSNAAKLPSIGLEVNGIHFVMPGSFLAFSSVGGGMHFGGIQSRGQNEQDIWGDVFLRAVYTVFDQGNMRVGFAQRTDLSA